MTQPGPLGASSNLPTMRQQTVTPQLSHITLTIEDNTGATWTTQTPLVPRTAERSAAAKVLGRLFALALLAAAVFASAWILSWVLGIVHDWWDFVPAMPYAVALKITLVVTLAVIIGTVLKVFVGLALGTSRLPESGPPADRRRHR